MESLKPDLAIVDITLRDTSGIELIKDIKIRFPKLPVLVLSMHDESFYAERALRAGARGYVMKEEASEKVMTAIRRVLAGEVYLSESVAARMLSKYVDGRPEQGSNPVERLSDRELEVFELIGRGLGTSQIAEKLHRSIKTIEAHRANIKRKLQLRTSPELLRMALQWVQTQETA
jgi:DNA-binding NarL/FixJ family response regulator